MKLSRGDTIFNIGVHVLIVIICVLVAYPIWHIFMFSFSEEARAVREGGLFLWPKGFSLNSYRFVLKTNMIFNSYKNSIIVATVGTTLNVLLTSMMAYALSRPSLMGRRTFSFLVFFTIIFNGGMIPTFIVVRLCGLMDSLWSIILPVAINPFYIFVMISFFRSIPDSLEDSAKIDGANDVHIFFKIVVPLSLPALASISVMYFVYHWNAFFECVLYINDSFKYTLQVLLRDVLLKIKGETLTMGMDMDPSAGASGVNVGEGAKAALMAVAVLPALIIYPFIQRFFIRGITLGAVKG